MSAKDPVGFTLSVNTRKKFNHRIKQCFFALAVLGSVPACMAQASSGEDCAAGGINSANLVSEIFVVPELAQSGGDPTTAWQWDLFRERDWEIVFRQFRDSGMTGAVIIHTAKYNEQTGKWRVYTPADGALWAQNVKEENKYGSRQHVLQRILQAARHTGIKVTIGLQLREDYWFNKGGWKDRAWIDGEAARAIDLATQIWRQYGKGGRSGDYSDVIAGWYLPYEVMGANYLDGNDSPHEQGIDVYVAGYLKPVTKALIALGGPDHIVASPFFSQSAPQPTAKDLKRLQAWKTLWTRAFSESHLSVVAPQDGLGAAHATRDNMAPWFSAVLEARDAALPARSVMYPPAAEAEVWGNAENYRDQNRGINHMPIKSLTKNLAAMKTAGVENLIMFSMHRLNGEERSYHGAAQYNVSFAEAYRRWAVEGECSRVPPGVPGNFTVSLGEGGTLSDSSSIAIEEDAGALNRIDTATLSWSAAHVADVTRIDQRIEGYVIVRNGRKIAEISPFTLDAKGQLVSAEPKSVLTFHDPQLVPGETYTYHVSAFDAWGTSSPSSPPVSVTVPLRAEQREQTDNLAAGKPYTVTRSDQVQIDGVGLRPATGQSNNLPATTYLERMRSAATDGIVASADRNDGRWEGRSNAHGAWTMTIPVPPGARIQQITSQWLLDRSEGISVPSSVEAIAERRSGEILRLGATGDQGAIGVDNQPVWLSIMADREYDDLAAIRLVVTPKDRQTGQWTLLGEVQAFDARGELQTLSNDYEAPAPAAPYTGERPATLADGVFATLDWWSKVNDYGEWTGRIIGAEGSAYFTVDLGADQDIEKINTRWLFDSKAGIRLPGNLSVRTRGSRDSRWSAWTAPLSLSASQNPSILPVTLPVSSKARYVQIKAAGMPWGAWLFSDELQVQGPISEFVQLSTPQEDCPADGECKGLTDLKMLVTPQDQYSTDWWASTSQWRVSKSPEKITYTVTLPQGTRVESVISQWLHDKNSAIALPRKITYEYLHPDQGWQLFDSNAWAPRVMQESSSTPSIWLYRGMPNTPVTTSKVRLTAYYGAIKPWSAPTWAAVSAIQVIQAQR